MSSVIVTYIKCSNCGHKFYANYVEDMELYADAYNKKEKKIENIDLSKQKNKNHIFFGTESIKQIPCPKCNKKKLEIIGKEIFH